MSQLKSFSRNHWQIGLIYLFQLEYFPKFLNKLKLFFPNTIFKKGDQQDCNNYRPISLLSNISKIIEKLVHRQLYGFLEFNNYLYTNQFGFRNLHSTNHALITITEKIRKAIDNRENTCGVFLDLQKVFDTVDHEIFLSKLEHYLAKAYVEYHSNGLKNLSHSTKSICFHQKFYIRNSH